MNMPTSPLPPESASAEAGRGNTAHAALTALRDHVERRILGQRELVERLLIAVLTLSAAAALFRGRSV